MNNDDLLVAFRHLDRIATSMESIQVSLSHLLGGDPMPNTKESDPDYLAALAAEVEGRIQEGATPNVGRGVDLQEPQSSEEKEGFTLNLFEQPRTKIAMLKEVAPKDLLLADINEETPPLIIAAIEVVYSHLSHDMWGTDIAKRHIAELIKLHKGEA